MQLLSRHAVFAVLLAVPLLTRAQTPPKYAVKSGRITYELSTSLGKATTVRKVVVTFDEHGAKERRDEYTGATLTETVLSDDVRRYKLQHARKAAFDLAPAVKGRGTELRAAWDEVSPSERSEGGARQLPAMTVAGKSCEAYEVAGAHGTTRVAGYKGVVLLFEVDGKRMKSSQRAVSVEEGVAVPADTFVVPEGYTVTR